MSTVQLPHWQEIQKGDEQSEPTRKRDWVEGDHDIGWRDPKCEPRQGHEDERVAEQETPRFLFHWQRADGGKGQTVEYGRYCHEEASPGTRRANVEKRAPIGRSLHADEGPERPDQERRSRNEEGRCGRDTMKTGHQKVSHFVGQQNRHQRERKRQAVHHAEWLAERVRTGEKGPGHGGCQEGREKQNDVNRADGACVPESDWSGPLLVCDGAALVEVVDVVSGWMHVRRPRR